MCHARTEQLHIFCCVTGFTRDFLSCIDVELIRFFHRALQLLCFRHMFYLQMQLLTFAFLPPPPPQCNSYLRTMVI